MIVPARKHALLASAAALLMSPLVAQASGLLMECSEGRLFIGYNVAENDECTASRQIEITGADGISRVVSEDAFIVAERSDGATIELAAGESGVVTARMTCEQIVGDPRTFVDDNNATTTVVTQRFENGCQRDEADLGGSLRPELNGALDTNLDEQAAPVIVTAPDSAAEEEEVVEEEETPTPNPTPSPSPNPSPNPNPNPNPNPANLEDKLEKIEELRARINQARRNR